MTLCMLKVIILFKSIHFHDFEKCIHLVNGFIFPAQIKCSFYDSDLFLLILDSHKEPRLAPIIIEDSKE